MGSLFGVRNDLFSVSRFMASLGAEKCSEAPNCDEAGDELRARFLLLCVLLAVAEASELSGRVCHVTWSLGVVVGGVQLKASSVFAMRSSMGIRTAGVWGKLASESIGRAGVQSWLAGSFSPNCWFSLSSSSPASFPSNSKDFSFFLDCEEISNGADGMVMVTRSECFTFLLR